MADLLKHGAKVKYFFKGEWFEGVVHGIKTHEQENGIITRVAYLIDTGNNTRIDEFPFNHRDREIDRRVHKIRDKQGGFKSHEDYTKVLKEVSGHTDLPESKNDVERVRQPEQVEVDQNFVEAVL